MSEVVTLSNAHIFQKGIKVLSNVQLSVQESEFIFLIGKTGSGKSSLMKTLYGELQLEEGEGHFAEFNFKKLKRKHIPLMRRKIGIVFQDFQLLMDRNILQNLYFVLKATGWKKKKEIHERSIACLKMVGLEEMGAKMPHELSGGEQQRVSIARALLNDPKLILADEPTGNLDSQNGRRILDLMRELLCSQNIALLLVTHSEEAAAICNTTWKMQDGNLIT